MHLHIYIQMLNIKQAIHTYTECIISVHVLHLTLSHRKHASPILTNSPKQRPTYSHSPHLSPQHYPPYKNEIRHHQHCPLSGQWSTSPTLREYTLQPSLHTLCTTVTLRSRKLFAKPTSALRPYNAPVLEHIPTHYLSLR